MHKPKKKKLQSTQKRVDWLEYIDNSVTRAAVPVGPRFQAAVLDWTGPSINEAHQAGDRNLDSSRWLGDRTWPTGEDSPNVDDGEIIGKGRPDVCNCKSPGSTECVMRHVSEERDRIRSELGPAFETWKFNKMGEDISKSWTAEEEKKFKFFVRMNPVSQGRSFLKPALTCCLSKTREEIVSYYLNVYIPRQVSMKSRSGTEVLYSDDDEKQEDVEPDSKNSRKRSGSRRVRSDGSKSVRPQWLVGRR